MKTIYVNQFDGGITSDPRDPRENVCQLCEHFDIFTNRYKLTPYRNSVTGDSSQSTDKIVNYVYDGTTIYGWGDDHSGNIKFYSKTTFDDGTWSAIALSGFGSTLAGYPLSMVWYQTTAKFYGISQSRYAFSVTPSGPSATTQAADLGGSSLLSTTSNSIVHSKDDILYMGYDNKIASNNNDSWTTAALTLPSSMVVVSICEYGNYLAIGCRDKSGLRSRVYLWDRDSTINTLSETIDWGDGRLFLLEQFEGYLIGVSFEGMNTFNTLTRVTARYYSSTQGAIKFAEQTGNTTLFVVNNVYKTKQHNRLLFAVPIGIGSTNYYGVWAIGRNAVGQPLALTMDRLVNNGTSISGGQLFGCLAIGDYLFVSYIDSDGTYYMDKTDSSNTGYTASSIYESTINPQMPLIDRPALKQLVSFGANYESLPANGQVIGKIRVDGGSWTTVFTETADGVVYTEPFTKDSSGTAFTKGREFEFHLESTGGAVITGFTYKYEVQKTNL